MAGSLSRYFGDSVRQCLEKARGNLPSPVRGLAERCKLLPRTDWPSLFIAQMHFSEQTPVGVAS